MYEALIIFLLLSITIAYSIYHSRNDIYSCYKDNSIKRRKIHQIWIQGTPCATKRPREFKSVQLWKRWCASNDCEYELWTMDTFRERFPQYTAWIPPPEFFQKRLRLANLSSVLRACILYEEGGLYVDVDIEPVNGPIKDVFDHEQLCVTSEWSFQPVLDYDLMPDFPSFSVQNNWIAAVQKDVTMGALVNYYKDLYTHLMSLNEEERTKILRNKFIGCKNVFILSRMIWQTHANIRLYSPFNINAGNDFEPTAICRTIQ